jgi:hypothetical protein
MGRLQNNPSIGWVHRKFTHKKRKRKRKNKTSLQMLQEFARGHGRGEQGLKVE